MRNHGGRKQHIGQGTLRTLWAVEEGSLRRGEINIARAVIIQIDTDVFPTQPSPCCKDELPISLFL